MRTVRLFLAAVLVSWSAFVAAASGYYVVVDFANGAYVAPLYQGYRSGCFVLPSMAINSALSNLASVQALGVNGYWRANKTNLTTRYYSGLFYPCEDAQQGTVPAFASGVTDPVLTNAAFALDASTDATLATLQGSVADMQSALAAQAATLSTIENAQAEEFDVDKAFEAFSFFFGSILLLWSVGKGGGAILAAVRRR